MEKTNTEAEVLVALKLLPEGRVPGPDGIPTEFYLIIKDLLLPLSTAVFNECWCKGELPADFQ
jgi:hypothetical protein